MEFQDRCPNCGQPRSEGAAFCGSCGKPYAESKPVEPHIPPPLSEAQARAEEPAERQYVAWEDRENVGFFAGLWETWKESVFGPEAFFSKLPHRGGLGNPLFYALIVAWIGIAVEQMWSLLFSGMMYDLMADFIPSDQLYWTSGLQTGFSILYLVFLAPILIVLSLFVTSGIYHLIMMIFGWAKRDFEATFRAMAYATGPILFYIIPMCGGLIGLVWSLVLSIIGLKHMQKTTGGKAAVTIFLPIVLCCCVIIILGLIFGAALLSIFRQAMNSGYNFE